MGVGAIIVPEGPDWFHNARKGSIRYWLGTIYVLGLILWRRCWV